MKRKQKRQRQFKPVTVAALYAALADGTMQGVNEIALIGAQHTPTTARLFGRGLRKAKR